MDTEGWWNQRLPKCKSAGKADNRKCTFRILVRNFNTWTALLCTGATLVIVLKQAVHSNYRNPISRVLQTVPTKETVTSRDIVDGITRLWTRRPKNRTSIPGTGTLFPLSPKAPTLALRPTQPPIQWVRWSFPRTKVVGEWSRPLAST